MWHIVVFIAGLFVGFFSGYFTRSNDNDTELDSE